MAVFIEQPTPFLEEFLTQIEKVDYPKNKIHLFVHNNVEYHEEDIDKFYKTSSKKYLSAKRVKPSDFMSEAEARNVAKYVMPYYDLYYGLNHFILFTCRQTSSFINLGQLYNATSFLSAASPA